MLSDAKPRLLWSRSRGHALAAVSAGLTPGSQIVSQLRTASVELANRGIRFQRVLNTKKELADECLREEACRKRRCTHVIDAMERLLDNGEESNAGKACAV